MIVINDQHTYRSENDQMDLRTHQEMHPFKYDNAASQRGTLKKYMKRKHGFDYERV